MTLKSLVLAIALPLAATAAAVVYAPNGAMPTTDAFEERRSPSPYIISALFAADKGETRGALLVHDGKVVAKRFSEGYSDKTRFISWSMAKTMTAVLVGELVAEGRLQLDAPAPVAEWQRANDPRRAITLRQLLNMSSGLAHNEVARPVENSDTNQVLFVSGTDAMAARAIAQPLTHKPGTWYKYSSLTSLLLSEIVTRTLTASKDPIVRAKAYRAFAQARLWGPAGITSAVMDFDGAGTQIGGSIIYMTLDDYGRFGQLLLAGKAPGGAQVIAPDWLAFMRTPSPINAEYGGQTWLNRYGVKGKSELFPTKGPETLFACLGHLGQFVIVSPDQNMVLVRLGKTDDGTPATDNLREALGDITKQIPLKPRA